MPDYKKKKHNKILSSNKPKKPKKAKAEQREDIPMSSAEKYRKASSNTNMKVLKGKRIEQKRKLKLFSTTALIIIAVFAVLQFILPMGVFEKISNTAALLGTGNYPIESDGNKTINTISCGSYYYVLSNTCVNAYTNSGKVVFSYAHGFEKPIIKVSDSRALVFEQNGTKALIFTLNGLRSTVDTEQNIMTAGISDSGAYAIVCRSEKYASEVTVFSKGGKMLYKWFSAENTVNNVAVSPNGKKIAVSSFVSENGKYRSVINVLNFKSAQPDYTENIENSLVYNIDTSSRSVFTVITENSIEFIKWSKYNKTEYKNDYSIALFRPQSSGFVAVFNRKNDKTDNRLAVFSNTGKLKSEIEYKGIITDIAISGGNIYCMSETELQLLSKDGKLLRKASCGFGATHISVTSANSVAVITDNKIEKINLEQEQNK